MAARKNSNPPQKRSPQHSIVRRISNLPPKRSPQLGIAKYTKTRTKAEIYKGPLPHPKHLEAFEKIVPGSAKMLFDVFQKQAAHRMEQAAHRMECEKAVISASIKSVARGQTSAFIISMTTIIGGFILIAFDKNVGGIASILGALGVLITTFIIKNINSKAANNT